MDQEKTYKWIRDRLHDLHTGNLSDADRMQLEEIAKTDPFIRDALEGYQTHAEHDHSALLNVLSQRIQNKSKAKRTKLLPLSRGWVLQAVAASLVLILATWVVIYYVQKQNESIFVASEPPVKDSLERSIEVELSAPDTLSENPGTGNVAAAESPRESESYKNNAKTVVKPNAEAMLRPAIPHPSATAQQPAKVEKDQIVLNDQPNVSGQNQVLPSPPSAPAILQDSKEKNKEIKTTEAKPMAAGSAMDKSLSKRDEGYYANQMSPELMSKRVTGHISDRHGEALISALIDVPNTNLFTTTDDHGNFELYLPKPTSELEVTYTGYADTTLTVEQGQENIVIILHALNDLEQVKLIDGIPFQKSKSANTTFLEYLKSHSHFDIENNFTTMSKEVTVEFKVSTDGHPNSIKSIKSSADKKYMAEAIRLINEGPIWVCDDGVYPCMKKYTIYFQ